MEYNEIDTTKIDEIVVPKKTTEQLFKDCLVDLDTPPPPLDVLVYIGVSDRGIKTPSITRGEVSCIYAPSKAKKSFAKSLIEAAFVGGNSEHYSKHFVGNRRTEGMLISIDTEQGEFYAQRSFRRIEQIVGSRYKNYIPLKMRKQTVKDRLRLIDWIIYKSEYRNKIDMITIDGLADLVENTNDIEVSTALAEKLLQWSAIGLHICFVLHKNPNSQKARGHLGSITTIKCETMISMDGLCDDNGNPTDEKNTVKISCSHSRGISFEPFYLTVNREGLPFTHTNEHENNYVPFGYKEPPLKLIDNKDAFETEIPF